jgi:dynein heavy chain, axonemal
MAAAFISYIGPFSKTMRDNIIQNKFLPFMKENKIPMSAIANPVALLTSAAVKAKWNSQGLPPDAFSTENGTIITNCTRYPLLIDPQLQGIKWIKEKEKENGLVLLKLNNFKKVIQAIEMSIQAGNTVLIENIMEEVDAQLNPVIGRKTIKKGRKRIMQFAGKEFTLDPKFKLYMQTKLSSPDYPPEIQAEMTLINFTVTENGLADQLLDLVVKMERPDLSSKRVELINNQNAYKIQLADLEADLLFRLANAPEDILSDVDLVLNLEKSKKISEEIKVKVELAQKTQLFIDEASEAYRFTANRGALLFFLMNDLFRIHTFYKYSLQAFLVVVHRAIDMVEEGKLHFDLPESKDDEEEEAPAEDAGAGEEKPAEDAPAEGAEGEEKKEGEEGADGEKKEGDGDAKAEGEGGEEAAPEEEAPAEPEPEA